LGGVINPGSSLQIENCKLQTKQMGIKIDAMPILCNLQSCHLQSKQSLVEQRFPQRKA